MLGDGRAIRRILVLCEAANALDWATSVIGIGGLGLPEQSHVARWFIAQFGVLGGMTMFKAAVGMGFAVLAWGATAICQGRWRGLHPRHAIEAVGVMGLAGAAMAQQVIWNLAAIAAGALGGPVR